MNCIFYFSDLNFQLSFYLWNFVEDQGLLRKEKVAPSYRPRRIRKFPPSAVPLPRVSCSLKQEAIGCRRGLIGRTGPDDDSGSDSGTLGAPEGRQRG